MSEKPSLASIPKLNQPLGQQDSKAAVPAGAASSKRSPGSFRFFLFLLLLLAVQTALAVFFCSQKQGMHYDEYFSYYASNGTLPMTMEDRSWNDTSAILDSLVSTDGESFHYGFVYRNQTLDVHPPVYYFALHTISSFFPGVYSKWMGLSLNLVCFWLCFLLLAGIAWELTKNRLLTLAVLFVYGFSPGTLSGVTFIRMYMLVTVFILLFVWLHLLLLRNLKAHDAGIMIPLMGTVFFGFLTQYYFAVFQFFFCLAFCFYLLFVRKRLKGFLYYALSMLAPLAAAVLFYPASVSHIFSGYRGKDVQTAFLDAGNLLQRFAYFTGLTNENVFSHTMWILAAILLAGLLLGAVALRRHGNRDGMLKGIPAGGFLIAFSVVGYYLLVSKITLMLGSESNRYFIPVYGLLLMLVVLAFGWLFLSWQKLLPDRLRLPAVGTAVLLVVFVGIDLYGYQNGSVLHLYPEQASRLAYAREHRDDEVLVLTKDCWIWDDINELLNYGSVYYVQDEDMSPITDERIKNSRSLTAYINNMEPDKLSSYLNLVTESTGLKRYRQVYRTKFYDVYFFE